MFVSGALLQTDTGTQGCHACAAGLSSSPRRPHTQVGKTSLYTSTLGNMTITVPAKAGKEGTSFNLGAGLFPGQSPPWEDPQKNRATTVV